MSCRSGSRLLLLALLLVGWFATPAAAMHIADGILPAQWAGLWFVVAAPFLWWATRVVRREIARDSKFKVLLALVGAGVFILSCMPVPVPVAGTSSHPCATGVAAVLVGPAPAILVGSLALLFQALLLAHGGLATLGANMVSMAVVGALAGYGSYRLARRLGAPLTVAAFFAGLAGDWATYLTTSFELAAGLHGEGPLLGLFLTIAAAFVPTQAPLGVLEGLMAAGAMRFLAARRPELLATLKFKEARA